MSAPPSRALAHGPPEWEVPFERTAGLVGGRAVAAARADGAGAGADDAGAAAAGADGACAATAF